MEELSNTVINYFGALTEVRNNLPTEVPEKPRSLIYTEQILSTGHLLVDGGLLDQPYIWMKEFKICYDLIQLFKAQEEAQRKTRTS